MILDCYQCSSCYFEDKEPSSRINPDTISAPQPRKVFRNVLVAFVCVEVYDDRQELQQATEEFELVFCTPDEIEDMIRKNQIWDGMTLAAWMLARHEMLERLGR